MAVHDPLYDREAHARPRVVFGAVQPLKDSKQFACVFHVEPDTIVSHEIYHRANCPVSLAANFDEGGVALSRILDRIGNQVDPHLLEQRPIGQAIGKVPHADVNFPAFHRRQQLADAFIDQPGRRDGLFLEGLAAEPREGQQVVDQAPHLQRVRPDVGEILHGGGRQLGLNL